MKVEFKGLKSQPCCPPEPKTLGEIKAPWADGVVSTPVGNVPRVRAEYLIGDRLGTFKARWGVGRMHYIVEPGLYAVGNPTAESAVFVSANYKMSFDRLRRELKGMDAWLLVLDTKGINVWCAAGKGTFGTAEIVRSIAATGLERIVSHRTLVLPQLGAPGVSAHEVKKQSGFRVVYGPVRAADIPEFMANGMRATPEMRHVRFPLADRVALIPMELVLGAKWAAIAAVALFVLSGLGAGIFSVERMLSAGSLNALVFAAAYVLATSLGSALLPWIPGRSFSWALIITAVSSFMVMNFTGSSTYTSLSGVKREMRYAVPAQLVAAVLGTVLWIGGRFVS
jgi:acetyl-CoA decarbonylase/synthase complex subunit gamma